MAASFLGVAVAIGGGLTGPALGAETCEATWQPERPIQVVIQFAAGGGTDTVIRTLLKELEPILGQRITATNMTGALGSIATEYVLNQPADGYAWLGAGGFLDYPRIMAIHEAKSWEDFQFFQAATSLASWATHPDSQFQSFADVIDFAKANPGQLTVSTDGQGGLWHEAIAIIASKSGFEFTNVPFDGGAPATLAAVQQEVDVAGSGLHEQVQFIRSGQLRNLAVFTPEPVDIGDGKVLEPITKYVPEAEANAPFGGMYNVALRRDTPDHILCTVEAAVAQAVASEGFQAMLEQRFMKPTVVAGEAMDKKAARLEVERAELFNRLGIGKNTAADLDLPAPDQFDQWWPPEGYAPTY